MQTKHNPGPSIVLTDYRFLYSFIRLMRRDNTLPLEKLSPRLRKLSKGYNNLVDRTVELFMLFDHIYFYCNLEDYEFHSADGEIEGLLPLTLMDAAFEILPKEIKSQYRDKGDWYVKENAFVIADQLELLNAGGRNQDYLGLDSSLPRLATIALTSFTKPPSERWVPEGCEGAWSLVLEHAISTNPVLGKIPKPVLEAFLGMYLSTEYSDVAALSRKVWNAEPPKKEIEYLVPVVYPLAHILRSGILIGSMLSRAGSDAALAFSLKGNFPGSNIKGAECQIMRLLVDACYEEGLSLPKVTTATDLFRLRQSPALKDFREMFWLWVRSLSRGDSLEPRIRQDVAKANRALKKVETCTGIGKWLTYFAIPVALAEMLITIPVISSAMAITSIALDKYGDKLKKDASWISFMLRA